MNEKKAREILGDAVNKPYGSGGPGSISCLGHYMAWSPGDGTITLDSEFSLDEIEAIAWWMRNKLPPDP